MSADLGMQHASGCHSACQLFHFLCLHAGVYLPLTAVLGGLLFVRVEGYLEADRDVIRLAPDVAVMQEQQGYVCCMPQEAAYVPGQGEQYVAPLHCCVRVLPSQVCCGLQLCCAYVAADLFDWRSICCVSITSCICLLCSLR